MKLNKFQENFWWGAWVVPLVKSLTLGFGSSHDLRVVRSTPASCRQDEWCPLSSISRGRIGRRKGEREREENETGNAWNCLKKGGGRKNRGGAMPVQLESRRQNRRREETSYYRELEYQHLPFVNLSYLCPLLPAMIKYNLDSTSYRSLRKPN